MLTLSDRAAQFKIGVVLALGASVTLLFLFGFSDIVAVALITALAFLFGAGFLAYFANSRRLSQQLAEKRMESETAAKGFDLLNAMAAAATIPSRPSELLEQALGSLLEITGLEMGCVYLLDEQDQKPRVHTFREVIEGLLERALTRELGERIVQRVIASGDPVFIQDIAREGWQLGFDGEHPGVCSIFAVPMTSKQRVIGVLTLASCNYRKAPGYLCNLLCAIGISLGTIIENARLYEMLDTMNDKLIASNLRISEVCDIAEKRAAELETVISSIPYGILLCDKEGRLTMSNKAAERLLGRPVPMQLPIHDQAQILGLYKPSGEAYSARETPLMRSALEGISLAAVDVVVRMPDGERRTLQFNSAPVLGTDGQLVGAVAVFADVTSDREIDKLKDEFIFVASHELKNPLTSMKGWTQLLLRSARQTPGREMEVKGLEALNGQMERLVSLVDKMVDFTRIRAGVFELNRQPTDLVRIARTMVDLFQVTTDKHQVRFESSMEELIGYWDGHRIEQVLSNLIDNAIKYSPDGGEVRITIAVGEPSEQCCEGEHEEAEKCRALQDWAVVRVEDQGVGISSDTLNSLFQRFGRAERIRKTGVGGLGLGLYISHQIVAEHGGRIWVQSEEGRGSTFAFALPITSPPTNVD